MARVTDTAPNRILAADTLIVNKDPLIALLNLETDDGAVELLVNRAVAEMLIDELSLILGRKSPD